MNKQAPRVGQRVLVEGIVLESHEVLDPMLDHRFMVKLELGGLLLHVPDNHLIPVAPGWEKTQPPVPR